MTDKAIIFIPGIGGSNLHVPGGKKLYLSPGFMAGGSGFANWFANKGYPINDSSDYTIFGDISNQLEPRSLIKNQDIIPMKEWIKANIPFEVPFDKMSGPGYDKTFTFFENEGWSIREAALSWQMPYYDSPSKDAFFEFPYDWRLSARDNAQLLDNLIQEHVLKEDENPNREIYLVSHSAGCLVSRTFLKNANSDTKNHINAQIMLGPPNHGAPKIYRMVRTGKGFLREQWLEKTFDYLEEHEVPHPNIMKPILSQCPFAYELLPNSNYEELSRLYYGAMVSVDASDEYSIEGSYKKNNSTIFPDEPHKALQYYSLNNDLLVNQALTLHDELERSSFLPDKTYIMYSSKIKTITKIEFSTGNERFSNPIYTKCGDGTVPAISSYDLEGITESSMHTIINPQYTYDYEKISHAGLARDDRVLSTVLTIVNDPG